MKWRLRRGGSDCSAGINLTPVPNADDPNHQLIVLQGADDSIISNPVFPEITSGPCNLSPIFWGSSSFSIRLRRNLRIRLAIGLSSFRSCLRALLESSMFQAIEPHHFPAERSCFVRSGSLPAPFGRSRCLPGHPNIEGSLRERSASGLFGEAFEALFDFFGQADGEHGFPRAIQVLQFERRCMGTR